MIQINAIDNLREQITTWKQQGLSIGFVPTMGNLHQGHLHLVDIAKQHADKVVVSIFVNPMQFERETDLNSYPRTETADAQRLIEKGVDILFLPTPQTIYPEGINSQTFVEVPHLGEKLEGAQRPGHFRGVSTIVCKLFNLVQPDCACFGEKDFQQLALIRKMVADLAMPINVIGVPTVRDHNGLAMSSRNNLLSSDQLEMAPALAKIMIKAGRELQQSSTPLLDTSAVINSIEQELSDHGFSSDGIYIVDSHSLEPLNSQSKQAVILMAAYLGKIRLIDNLVVDLNR